MSDQWRSNDVKYALGPELIGSAAAVFFQGLFFDQTVNYFALSGRSDRLILRAYVAALTGLLTVNSMLNWASLWHTTITFFGRLQDISRKVLIFSSGNRILLVFIAFSVQTFFLHRLSQLSKSRVLIVLILCIMLATAVAGLLAPITMLLHCLNPCPPEYLERTEIYYQVHLALLMVTDVLLTCFTAYFLLRIRRIVLPRTAGTINNLLRLCVQTAAPGTLGVFLTFAFSVVYVNPAASDRTFAAGAVYTTLPGFWGLSVVWTLNARDRRRQRQGRFPTTVHDTTKEWDAQLERSRTEGNINVGEMSLRAAVSETGSRASSTTSRSRSFESMVDEGEVVQPLHRHPVDAAVSSMLSGSDVD